MGETRKAEGRVLGREKAAGAALTVVHGRGALFGKFREEELGERGDALVGVEQAERELRDLPLHLDHVVEDEVHEHHEHVLAHTRFAVAQLRVEVGRPRREDVRVAEEEVAERDGDVGADGLLGLVLHHREEQLQLRVAKFR